MKNVIKSVCLIVIVCSFLIGCDVKKNNNDLNYTIQSKDSSGVNYYNTQRQLVHKASIDIQVNDCINTTNKIEEKTIQFKGFILQSTIERQITKTVESIISTDSIKQINYFENKANMVVRVPDTSMQSFLLYIQQISSTIQKRSINADDLTFALHRNSIDATIVENNNISNVENKSNKIIDLVKLKDELNFCTISILINEPIAFVSKTIINTDAYWSKQTSIWNKFWYNLQKGFNELINAVAFLVQFWFLVPIIFVTIFCYKSRFIL